jgi:hypothetical protein
LSTKVSSLRACGSSALPAARNARTTLAETSDIAELRPSIDSLASFAKSPLRTCS